MSTHDCRVCGGEGWLPSLPEGESECPYCKGTGKDKSSPLPKMGTRVYDVKITRRDRTTKVVQITAPDGPDAARQALDLAESDHPSSTVQLLGSKGGPESPLVRFGGSS